MVETINLEDSGVCINEIFQGIGKEPNNEQSLVSGLNLDYVTEKATQKHNKLAEKELVKSIVTSETKPSPEDTKKHQELIIHLSRYYTSKRFSEYLRTMGFNLNSTHLKKLSVTELEELLQRIQTSVEHKTQGNLWGDMALGGIQTVETIATSVPKISEKVKLRGLTDALRQDDQFLDLIEQLELSHSNFTHVRPEIRLMYSITSSAMRVHAINSFMEKRGEMINQHKEEVKEDTEEVKEEKVEEAEGEEKEEEVDEEKEQVLTTRPLCFED
jgi:hypothetical protein